MNETTPYNAKDQYALAEEEKRGKNLREKVLWMILFIIAGWGIYRLNRNTVNIDRNFIIEEGNAKTLADKINPNTSSWASMARLPGFGIGRAKAVVKFREAWREENNDKGEPFKNYQDLCKIKGIGEKTAEHVKDYLIFSDS